MPARNCLEPRNLKRLLGRGLDRGGIIRDVPPAVGDPKYCFNTRNTASIVASVFPSLLATQNTKDQKDLEVDSPLDFINRQ
jgi:hypothetical protein